ncbi:MAG TPA: hypothetical protein VGN57_17485 [Pirellulaceae bacterium]|jgi:hypothetical protein|nr:hypothetical protein [Pirellulaceae bacterium]
MDLRSGNSSSRRRRVLREDAPTGDAESPAPRRKTRVRIDAAHYPEAAHPHRQPRLADLLPTKWWSIGLAVGAGVLLAALVLTGFAYRASLAGILGEEALRPLDPTLRGNLADWLASWTLLTAAIVAGIVYSLRRHRTDDYRGRYRVWLWTAAALALGAIDAACGLHRSLSGAIVALTGVAVCGQGAFWWLLVEGLILVAVSAAMTREYLRCRLSLAALSLTLLAYAGLAAATVYRIDVSGSTTAWLAQESFRLFGHLLLTLSVLLYARHVLREVQGMTKSVRRKRKAKADAAGDDSEEPRVPAPHFRKKPDASNADAAKAKSASSSSTAAASVAKAPTPPPAPKPEPPRPQAPPVASKPAATSAEARSSDAKSNAAPSGEVRRTDPPSKPAGPLAGKLRPSNGPVTSPVASRPSGDDDEEEDDDRTARKNKKRGR